MFPKESDESEHNKVFLYFLAFLSECWNSMGATLNESLKTVSKNRDKTLPSLCSVSLDEGKRRCGFAEEAFSE